VAQRESPEFQKKSYHVFPKSSFPRVNYSHFIILFASLSEQVFQSFRNLKRTKNRVGQLTRIYSLRSNNGLSGYSMYQGLGSVPSIKIKCTKLHLFLSFFLNKLLIRICSLRGGGICSDNPS
jgi:hypothetical protein